MSKWLLPGWASLLERAPKEMTALRKLPLAVDRLVEAIHVVSRPDDGQLLIQTVQELPISAIGIDSEFRFTSPDPIELPRRKTWRDIRTVFPFCIAFAIVSNEKVVRFVVDMRVGELLNVVQEVLNLPIPFVCHYAPSELFTIWKHGLREPRTIWDTYLAERALRLGRTGYRRIRDDDPVESIENEQEFRLVEQQTLDLDAVSRRYGITTKRSSDKRASQQSFLTKPFHAELTPQEMEYCALDAQLAAAIREPQRVACDRHGLTEMLDRVVMPWNVTAAEMCWTGVRFDRAKCQSFLAASAKLGLQIAEQLGQFGITNPASGHSIANFLQCQNLAAAFPRTQSGRPSTQDDHLKDREHLHPALPLIRRWRKIKHLESDCAVTGQLTGVDGRVHAEFRVLGSATGRTQSSRPNLMGTGRIFRPFITATEGYGIGDVDLSQIEVGIAAAVFGDDQLIAAFNEGDVYVAAAKKIWVTRLTDDDLAMSPSEFKKKHKCLRDQTKPLILGIIYGKSTRSIAQDLRISLREAKALWGVFRSRYPVICDRMEAARQQSIRRGYAYMSGLRRYRSPISVLPATEGRSLGNAYVQGTAASVFFDAGNRLRRLYRRLGARLIIPVHDSFVFEAPWEQLAEVAQLTRQVMVQTVQEWFPDLNPRAEVNISHPECWNHEGNHDSVERFLENPMMQL